MRGGRSARRARARDVESPYRDGTTHILLEPLDFLARLASLVPPPRAHLTRYHGVFAPHAALRAAITPAFGTNLARRTPPMVDDRIVTSHAADVQYIQRFGSALNLNIHFHALFLDGAYLTETRPPVFRRIAAPSEKELQALVQRIAERISRALERNGVLVRDCENSYLSWIPRRVVRWTICSATRSRTE